MHGYNYTIVTGLDNRTHAVLMDKLSGVTGRYACRKRGNGVFLGDSNYIDYVPGFFAKESGTTPLA